ncbi:hypothetical protein [Mangrovibrevibacter kandeliae]|uniref:hypothetical protein n=1 Tax=Mangrovibrevibacter kandeliae TaxID=2968473 RepID=UPI002117E28F|nr:hypothetical protein [Aurantimonas sp. CSK15Z-1]MCQ8781691.1 hypothetical protein [Aurantimonas sp. CSK15Z-1]
MLKKFAERDRAAVEPAAEEIQVKGTRWAAGELVRLREVERQSLRLNRVLTLGRERPS